MVITKDVGSIGTVCKQSREGHIATVGVEFTGAKYVLAGPQTIGAKIYINNLSRFHHNTGIGPIRIGRINLDYRVVYYPLSG